jgi:hypothetical protein
MDSKVDMNNTNESRIVTRQHQNFLLKVASLEQEHATENTAFSSNISERGIGLLVFHPLPVGTIVELILNSKVAAIGEVVHVIKNINDWKQWGLDMMGVKLIVKNKHWPVITD